MGLLKSVTVGLALFVVSAWAVAETGGVDQGVVNKCKECHAKQVDTFFAGNPHSKTWEHRGKSSAYSCESCHGPGEKHMKDKEPGSIIGFGKGATATPEAQSKQCLTCHKDSEMLSFWDMGKHKKNDVSCASCHSMHKGSEVVKPGVETCLACHKDIRAQINKRSHHPIIEGKVSCKDCHNPHGTLNGKMLVADSVNQLCLKCHADKRGPFLWEHAPVEENCMTCHTPHGSTHGKLLVEKVPNLCKDCHVQEGHGNAAYDGQLGFGGTQKAQFIGKGCLNCHTRIHGSNSPGNGHAVESGQYFIR